MTPVVEIDAIPKFTFLTLPPPPKRKRAAVGDALGFPASSVNCSNPILAWAETVHPGSPAPMTPASGVPFPRNASFTSSPLLQAFRRPSPNCAGFRRQSVSSTSSNILPASFLHVSDTPCTPVHHIPATPFSTDAKFDFAAFGYASIFVDLPGTPITPDIYKPKSMTRLTGCHDSAVAPLSTTVHTKFGGTGVLKRLPSNKPKAESRAHPEDAAENLDPVVSDYVSVSFQKHPVDSGKPLGLVEKQKREVDAGALPPTAKQEALRQAIERDSLEPNTCRVMERVKRVGNADLNEIGWAKVIGGIETVYRDGHGGVMWDQEEEREFTHLLPSSKTPISARYPNAEGWVTYNHLKEFEKDDSSEFSSLPSSKHADLYHPCPLIVTDEAAEHFAHGRVVRCSSIAGSIVLPSPSVEPSNILLAIPSRPNRGRHLQPGFLKDVIAVPPTPSTPSAFSQTSSRPPRSPACATRFIINTSAVSGPALRQRSRSRSLPRRQRKPAPPPLKIIPTRSVNKLAVNVDPEEEDRKLFLENSFRPEPNALTSRWSIETTAPRPLQASARGSDAQTNDFPLVGVPKKYRRLGGFFKKDERKC